MFLKFKVAHDQDLDTEEWKVYECRNYSYRSFTFDKIIDYLIYMKKETVTDEELLAIPEWIAEADLKIVPEIDENLSLPERTVSDKHTKLLSIKCVHFEITPLTNSDKIHVVTIKDVYVLGDKGQTVDRIIPNVLK